MPRLAGAALAALMALAAGNQLLLAPAAANALPGDALYPVKRLNEQLAFALTFRAEHRQNLVNQISAERAAEVARLEQAQREAEVTDWEVVLRSLEEPRNDDEPGVLQVRTIVDEDDEEPEDRALAWDDDTRFSGPDRFEHPRQWPSGSRLRIDVRTRKDEELPLALRVLLLNAPEQPTATPTAIVSATAIARRPTHTPTPTEVLPTKTLTPTALAVTPTVTATAPTPTTTATVAASRPHQADERDSLTGLLLTEPGSASWAETWLVADRSGTEIEVDVRDLKGAIPDDLARLDRVVLEGKWQTREHRVFQARYLHQYGAGCQDAAAEGAIAGYERGRSIRLTGSDAVYDFDRAIDASVPETLGVGDHVIVEYLACFAGKKLVTKISRQQDNPDPSRELQGPVSGHDAGARTFVLKSDRGAGMTDDWTVHYGTAQIRGAATTIRNGQILQVEGEKIGDLRLEALKIEVLYDPPEATATPTTASAPAEAPRSPIALPTPTPSAIDPSGPSALDGQAPLPLPGVDGW